MTTSELYKKYRPNNFDSVVGQPSAVKQLQGFLKAGNVPHAILFSGPSGCGKTTLARILAKEIGAVPSEITEINVADSRGIDTVREIESRINLRPLIGNHKVYILDEFHSITAAAAQAFLKMFEDAPKHVYFFVATSEPQKIAKALNTRLTHIKLDFVVDRDLMQMLDSVLYAEYGSKCCGTMLEKLAVAASGSPRKALVLAEQWVAAGSTTEAMQALVESAKDEPPHLIDLCRELIKDKPEWSVIYRSVQAIQDSELESARWMILKYAEKCMGDNRATFRKRAARLAAAMSKPFFDGKRPEFLAKIVYFVEGA